MGFLRFERRRIAVALSCFVAGIAMQGSAWAVEPFKIKEIRAEGLQRLEIGTVLTYLPLSVGDELNDSTSREAIRGLYGSGLFQDVELNRDGEALVIKVKERPEIASFNIKGNEKIGGDDLKSKVSDESSEAMNRESTAGERSWAAKMSR